MPPTESQILTQTLLPPSSLQTILPLKQFTALFPASLRTSPQIPVLYRALQLQRGLDLDAIRENIASEARRGREQMRQLARVRGRDAKVQGVSVETMGEMGEGGEVDVEGAVFGVARSGRRKVHDGKSLCEGMEEAEGDLRSEVERLEDEVRRVVEECEGIVDELGGLEMGTANGIDVEGLIAQIERLREELMDGWR